GWIYYGGNTFYDDLRLVGHMKIVFVGKMGTGKTSGAKYLEQVHGFKRLSFADPVKELSADILNFAILFFRSKMNLYTYEFWSKERIEEEKVKPQVRKLIQLVGTEIGRELVAHENIWVHMLLSEADGDRIVVDDCRFPNEVDALRKAGFKIIRLERGNEKTKFLDYKEHTQELESHKSETALTDVPVDLTIYFETWDGLYSALGELVHSEFTLKTNLFRENTRGH